MTVEQTNKAIKILVVDDQAGMRLTLKSILSKRGYDVSMAEDGQKALDAAKETEFDVIFMDIKMPGMSGVEAFLKIKDHNPKARVIMMTAFALEDDIKRAIREGAYAVIHKPFEMDFIMGIIDECLDDRTLVLVVDDQTDDRDSLKAILEKKGHRVVGVESGEECLDQIKERRFNIILLDVVLPSMDGVETLKRIREIRPDAAVLMITGHSVDELTEKAMSKGSVACFNKPFDVDQLLAVVDKAAAEKKDE